MLGSGARGPRELDLDCLLSTRETEAGGRAVGSRPQSVEGVDMKVGSHRELLGG